MVDSGSMLSSSFLIVLHSELRVCCSCGLPEHYFKAVFAILLADSTMIFCGKQMKSPTLCIMVTLVVTSKYRLLAVWASVCQGRDPGGGHQGHGSGAEGGEDQGRDQDHRRLRPGDDPEPRVCREQHPYRLAGLQDCLPGQHNSRLPVRHNKDRDTVLQFRHSGNTCVSCSIVGLQVLRPPCKSCSRYSRPWMAIHLC